ncbi:MAG TPA: GNAT family N-acetyltransferase [Candidatus Binataceae bacterium]|nr:GNAT family N-acetyltransferase [Candidatus Binataceae bacterium]
MEEFEPSVMYSFVRGRQLEGTFPGDPTTGVWPITSFRINRGWGCPPERAWPYNGDASAWPPSEPPEIDKLAKDFRINIYQRVRTLTECRAILADRQVPVHVTVGISDAWDNPCKGRIPTQSQDDKPRGDHAVLLVGYDDSAAELIFRNSWGVGWGDKGYGYLPYDVFEATWTEGWFADLFPCPPRSEPKTGLTELAQGVSEHGGGTLHCRELVGADDERIAWVFVVERSGEMEVEEFFVRPQFRKRGYGKSLVRSIGELASARRCSLKFWISHADVARSNLRTLEHLLLQVGLHIKRSGVRWAPYVAVAQSDTVTKSQLPFRRGARPLSPYRPQWLSHGTRWDHQLDNETPR